MSVGFFTEELKMQGQEIERKYVIRRPSDAWLAARPELKTIRIEQTYLKAPRGLERRVRSAETNGTVRYTYTEKSDCATLCRMENEREITPEEYEHLLLERESAALKKTRYAFPYEGHLMELDCYPFWRDRAVLEVELSDPEEIFSLPRDLVILKDATEDGSLKNRALAKAAEGKQSADS